MGYTPQIYYGFTKHSIKAAMKSFKQFDANRSKTLSQYELQNLLNYVFSNNGMPPPNPMDVSFLLQKFDVSGDYQLSKKEVKRMLKELGGLKKYSHNNYKTFGHHKKHHKKHY